MIDPPLWDLMLSTQDSQPGNENGNAHFKITPGRVQAWVDLVGPEMTRDALDQLDELLSLSRLNWKSLAEQTQINFGNESEARKWLGLWWDLLVQALG